MSDSQARRLEAIEQQVGQCLQALARVEERQAAYEQVAHSILGTLQALQEQLGAILRAATLDVAPESTADLAAAVREQTAALNRLTAARQADEEADFEEAEPGDFEQRPE